MATAEWEGPPQMLANNEHIPLSGYSQMRYRTAAICAHRMMHQSESGALSNANRSASYLIRELTFCFSFISEGDAKRPTGLRTLQVRRQCDVFVPGVSLRSTPG
jgi:hypothetical protein